MALTSEEEIISNIQRTFGHLYNGGHYYEALGCMMTIITLQRKVIYKKHCDKEICIKILQDDGSVLFEQVAFSELIVHFATKSRNGYYDDLNHH